MTALREEKNNSGDPRALCHSTATLCREKATNGRTVLVKSLTARQRKAFKILYGIVNCAHFEERGWEL